MKNERDQLAAERFFALLDDLHKRMSGIEKGSEYEMALAKECAKEAYRQADLFLEARKGLRGDQPLNESL